LLDRARDAPLLLKELAQFFDRQVQPTILAMRE
jgi:hypothetical protein